ncbi:phage minor capsid protein [Glycomyces sp. A-F 0318]|uniref:phage minor capsid protein n=1 Tax=Glycomyces amatae TaxID=2881355 RepID=UPI001E32A53D|nr:phage minor capsid protein [Glycomyces amatae]MCD0446469.1 phage minor capsid protein [Glycomyces amatae]
MPVGRDSVTDASGLLADTVTDATAPLVRLAGRLLGAGAFDDDADRAWHEVRTATERARSRLREALRAAVPATAQAYIAGVAALLEDAQAAGLDVTDLGAPLGPLFLYTTGQPVTFAQAVEHLPDVDTVVRETAAGLMTGLDGAFTAAAARLEQAVRDASPQAGFTGLARETLRNAAWNRFLDRGLTVPDQHGRMHAVGSWTQTLCQTRLRRTATDAYLEYAGSAGIACVSVSVSAQRCVTCRPWEGRVLARDDDALAAYVGSGARPVPKGTLATAIAAGLLHPHCRHTLTAWIPGVSTLPDRGPDHPGGDAAVQREREIERHIDVWDRKADLALTRLDRLAAARHANTWRTKLTEHRTVTAGFLDTAHHEQDRPDLAAGLAAIFQAPATSDTDTDPAAPPSLGVDPGALLVGGHETGDVRVQRRLRQAASDAADAFTADAFLNPEEYLVRLAGLHAEPARTLVTFDVLDEHDDDFGVLTVVVTDAGRGPEVVLSSADAVTGAPDDRAFVADLGAAFVDAWNRSDTAVPDAAASLGVDPAGVLFAGTGRDARAMNYARGAAEQAAAAYTDQFGDYVEFDDLTTVGSVTYVDVLYFADPGDETPAGRFRIAVDGTSKQANRVEVMWARGTDDDVIGAIAASFADAWRGERSAVDFGSGTYPLLVRDMFATGNRSAVRDAVFAVFEEHDYGPFTVEVASAIQSGDQWFIKGDLLVNGTSVGHFERSLHADGHRLTAHHNFLSIDADFHGQGIAQAFNDHLMGWYQASRVESIRVYAALEAGGYAWARAGYEWAWESQANTMWQALTRTARIYQTAAERCRTDAAAPGTGPALAADLRARAAWLAAQAQAAFDLLERVDQTVWGAPDYPQPFDVSEVGRPAKASRDQEWIGKETLVITRWHGVKWINED